MSVSLQLSETQFAPRFLPTRHFFRGETRETRERYAQGATISRNRNWNQLENCQKKCSQFVLKCLYLARTGRLDILWSVNNLARTVMKWTGACDKRLARLIFSNIHHTRDYRQYCHVGKTAQQCRLGLFQDPDFAGDLERTRHQPRRESYVFSEVEHSFPSVGCARNKRQCLTVLQNQKIFSLDAGLRMDGLFALGLRVTFIAEYRITNPWGSKKLLAKSQNPNPNTTEAEMVTNCLMWTTLPQT